MTLALLVSLLVSATIPLALWLAEPPEYEPRHAAPDRPTVVIGG